MKNKTKKTISKALATTLLIGALPIMSNAHPRDIVNCYTSVDRYYSEKLAVKTQDEKVDDIYNLVKETYKYIDKENIESAFASARNSLEREQEKNKENETEIEKYKMDEYYKRVAIILAVMETESGFRQVNSKNTGGSVDYGIMQINECTIPTVKKALGDSVKDLKYKNSDNIEAGSYVILDLCYNKAKEKHPEDVMLYTFGYYNRGLYFENTKSWKYNRAKVLKQMNTRSKIYTERTEKYYKTLTEVEEA